MVTITLFWFNSCHVNAPNEQDLEKNQLITKFINFITVVVFLLSPKAFPDFLEMVKKLFFFKGTFVLDSMTLYDSIHTISWEVCYLIKLVS